MLKIGHYFRWCYFNIYNYAGRGRINLENVEQDRIENQVYSNRVVRSEFDANWETCISKSGYVIYVATSNNAEVIVLLADGSSKLLIFEKGGKVVVGGGGTSHYSKPHIARNI